MDKNNRLINIYIKIHNNRTITMDDLQYLAIYDPECFRKTCENVVYNIPESKAVMRPTIQSVESKTGEAIEGQTEEFNALAILEKLKLLEADSSLYGDVDAKRVRNLLGNLYMELLFPHNDKDAFIHAEEENKSEFDMKA